MLTPTPSVLNASLHPAPGVRYRSSVAPVATLTVCFPPRPPSPCNSFSGGNPTCFCRHLISSNFPFPRTFLLIFWPRKTCALPVSRRIANDVIGGINTSGQVFHLQRLGRVATAGPVERAASQAWSASFSRLVCCTRLLAVEVFSLCVHLSVILLYSFAVCNARLRNCCVWRSGIGPCK